MPLQQLLTVTKDANAHARLGDVRSQSLASTTSVPVEVNWAAANVGTQKRWQN